MNAGFRRHPFPRRFHWPGCDADGLLVPELTIHIGYHVTNHSSALDNGLALLSHVLEPLLQGGFQTIHV